MSQQPTAEVRRPTVGSTEDRNGAKRYFGKPHKSRVIKESERYAPNIPVTDTNRESGKRKSRSFICMSKTEPRPTWSFHIEWRPKSKTLRINLKNGTRREVEWVGLKPKQSSEHSRLVNGPLSHNLSSEAQKDIFGLQALLDKPSGPKGPLNQYCVGEPSGTKVGAMDQITCDLDGEEDDSDSVTSDEDQALGTTVVGVEVRSEALGETGGQKPVRRSKFSSPEATAALTPNVCAKSESARIIDDVPVGFEASSVVEERSHELGLLPLVQFSERNESDNDSLALLEDGSLPELCTLELAGTDGPGCGSPMLDIIEHHESGDSHSPFSCEPLDRIDPLDFYAFTKDYSGDVLSLEEVMSVWVSQKYKAVSKVMGMYMRGFESDCISLLRRIDEERKRLRQVSGPRCSTVKKGKRELRNLISSVNYEGKRVARS